MPNLTTNYSLYKPLVADPIDEDLWGEQLNDDMDDIDTLLRAGITTATQSSQTTGFTANASISIKYLYPCDAAGGAFAPLLPTAAAAGNGATVFFQKTDATSNAITITRAGSDTIDGALTYSITNQYGVGGLVSDGVTKWTKIASADAVFTGDSGSGGTSGLVPAPAAGDAALNKFLKANGLWMAVPTPVLSASFTSSNIPLSSGNHLYTPVAHGLGGVPSIIQTSIVCTSAEQGYSVNDIVVNLGYGGDFSTYGTLNVTADATNLAIQQRTLPVLVNKSTGATFQPTTTNWVYVLRAYI